MPWLGAKGKKMPVQVKDVGFVQTSEVVRQIEVTAGLKDINYQRVHAYKISTGGLGQKKATLADIERNQELLQKWGTKGGQDEKTLVLARSMYRGNAAMIEVCLAHIETIAFYLEAGRLNV